MPTYAVPGGALQCDVALPELPSAEGATPSWRVVRGENPGHDLETVHEFSGAEGLVWAALHAGEGAYRVSFPELIEFHVDAVGRTVSYEPATQLAPHTLRHLIIDQLLPHLLVIGGALVLHASGVGRERGALAFLGPSGVGKSSLAAAFVGQGAALLADDYVLLDQEGARYLAVPAYPGLRLWEDSAAHLVGDLGELPTVAEYTPKRRWTAPDGARATDRLPLHALVAVGSPPEPGEPDVRVGRLRGADAFMVVYQQAFRMERAGRDRQAADLDAFSMLTSSVPVYMVEYRRDYALLPQVVEAISEAVDDS